MCSGDGRRRSLTAAAHMRYLHLPDRNVNANVNANLTAGRKRQRQRDRKRNRHRERARVRSAPIRSPDDSKVKQKMLFASSKDALRRSLVGIAAEIQGTDYSEVAHESGESRVSLHLSCKR